MRRFFLLVSLVVAFAGLFIGGLARADSWLPPRQASYLSPNQQWRLTVKPRSDSSPAVRGIMEHRERGLWKTVWRAALVNSTSPTNAVVSNTGLSATFDDWSIAGHGRNVVVIYDERGQKVRKLALLDFLPRVYVDILPQSVSSIGWGDAGGNGHHFSPDGQQLILRVVVPQSRSPSASPRSEEFVDVALDASTGQLIPPHGPAWERALQAARTSYAELRARIPERFASFEAPLLAPASDDETDWFRYLDEANRRINPEFAYDSPYFMVLPRKTDKHYQRDLQWIKGRLLSTPKVSPEDMVLLGSPDAENLIRVLSSITDQLPPQVFVNTRVCIAAPARFREAVAKALARTGATYVPLDTDRPLPQASRRLLQDYFSRSKPGPP